jgi:hypothetical protein
MFTDSSRTYSHLLYLLLILKEGSSQVLACMDQETTEGTSNIRDVRLSSQPYNVPVALEEFDKRLPLFIKVSYHIEVDHESRVSRSLCYLHS